MSSIVIANGTSAAISGTFDNSGGIDIEGYNAPTQLVIAGSLVMLTGGGPVVLTDAGTNSQIVGAAAGDTLVNVNNTISGAGLIGAGTMSLDNQAAGIIDATGGNRLIVDTSGGTFSNEGLLEATAGNGLQISGSTTIANTGTILANGSNVYLDAIRINGGTLQSAGNEIQAESGTTTLSGVTIAAASTLRIDNGAFVDLIGTLTNKSALIVNGYNTATQLVVASPTLTLTGGGTVTLVDAGTNSQIVGVAAADKLINVNNTIVGAGLIGAGTMSLDNQAAGVIDATGGNRLVLNMAGGTFSNEGLLEATAGNGLQINGGVTIVNTGLIKAAGGNVYLDGVTVNSGVLVSTTSEIQVEGGNTTAIRNVTVASGTTLRVNNGAFLDVLGTITNKASLIVNGFNTPTQLIVDAALVTLTGAGKITLVDAGTGSQILGAAITDKLVNVNNTILGAGLIGSASMSLDNQAAGIIDATGGNRLVLDLSGGSFTNEGLLEATAGNGLQISGTTKVVNAGTLLANGANVYLDGATVTGGTLRTPSGQVHVEGGNTATLSGVTLAAGAVVQADNGAFLDLVGTLTNGGTVTIAGFNTATALVAASPTVTLLGGAVTLVDAGVESSIIGASTADLLVNVSSVISGAGLVSNGSVNIDNRVGGVIEASAGSALVIDTAYVVNTATLHESFTNEGVLASFNSGTGDVGGLTIANSIINNTGNSNSGQIEALQINTHVDLQAGTVIQGGTLSTASNGVITVDVGNTATLDGSTAAVTLNGSLAIGNGATLTLITGLTNDGTIAIQGYNTATQLLAGSATVTLTGHGQVQLYDAGSESQIGAAAAGDLLVNVNNTISGGGTIGVGGLAFDNQAAGIIDATNNSRLVLAMAGQSFSNEGLIEATAGAGLEVGPGTSITNSGTLLANGATIYLDGSTVTGGTLTSTSAAGSAFAVEPGNIATLSSVSITTGGYLNVNNAATADLLDTVSNAGTIVVAGYNTPTQLLAAGTSVTLTGGGLVQLQDSGTESQISATTAGDQLVNVNNVITGAGLIGNGVAFVNQAAGTIDATAGGRLYLNAAGQSFINAGLIEATSGGGLQVSGGTTITNTGTLLANGATIWLDGGAVTGGTLTSTALAGSGFAVEAGNIATLSGVSLTTGSSLNVNNSATIDLLATISNAGTIVLAGYNTPTQLLAAAASVTLTGGGLVQLQDSGTESQISATTAGDQLVNVNNVITGAGLIGNGVAFVNQAAGTIDATAGGRLYLNAAGQSFINAGLIEATSGGGLQVSAGTTITNTGTLLANGASIFLDGGAVSGGTLVGLSSGFAVEGGNLGMLSGVTVAAGTQINVANAGTLLLSGGVVNNGTITLAGYNTPTQLLVSAAALTLSGSGVVQLNDAGTLSQITGVAATDKLVNAGNTIQGAGLIGAESMLLDNRSGVINGNAGSALILDTGLGALTNEGTIEDSGGGGLVIQNATLTNSGTIQALDGGSVSIAASTAVTNLVGTTLNGGTWGAFVTTSGHTATLAIAGGGPVVTDAANIVLSGAGSSFTVGGTAVEASLTTITAAGALRALGGRGFTTSNTISDSGIIQIAGGTFSSAGTLSVASTGTIQGDGRVASTIGGSGLLKASAGGVLALIGHVTGNFSLEADTGTVLQINAAPVTTDTTSITLSGAGSDIRWGSGSYTTIETSLTTIASGASFSLLGGRGYTTANALTDSGSLVLAGGTLTAGALSVTAGGVLSGSGTVATSVANSGTVIAQGGLLLLAAAPSGTGMYQAAAGATLAFGASSSTGAVTATGTVQLAGATLTPTSLTVAAGGRLLGFGAVAGVAVANSGTIEARGGTLLLAGTTGTGALQADAGATLELTASGSAGAVSAVGALRLDGVTLSASSVTVAPGGVLIGTGTVASAVATSGLIEAGSGTLVITGKLTGTGRVVVDSAATLDLAATPSITTLTSSVTLNGAGSVLEGGSGANIKPVEATLTTIGGGATLAVLGGRNFSATNAVSSNGTLQLGGGTYSGPGLTQGPTGRLLGFGTMASVVNGSGTIDSRGGLLKLAAGATGSGALLVEAGSTLELAAASTAGAVSVSGTLQLDGVTLTPTRLAVVHGGRLVGTGTVAGAVADAGTVEATGSLKLSGAVSSFGTLQIDAGTTLELGSTAAASDVVAFATGTGTLQLDAPGGMAATIVGFGGSDVIGLGGAVATSLTYSTTTKILTVTGASGTIASLKFAGSYTQASFKLANGGTQIVDPPAAVSAHTVAAASPSFLAPAPSEARSPWQSDWSSHAADFAAPAAPQSVAWSGAGLTEDHLNGGMAFGFALPAASAMHLTQHTHSF